MKIKLNQWCLFALLIGVTFLMQNCQVENMDIPEDIQNSTELGAEKIKDKDKDKLDVCHYDVETGLWSLKSYSINAIPMHLLHGDVVIDEDKDGFAVFNECGVLNDNGIDCDDNDSSVNPDVKEICGDGIDNDCDGQVDEYCTYVPDDNFEQELIDLGYDDVLDDYVLTENINTITILRLYSRNVSDLTGIEDFIALTSLSCFSNSLTSLDVSQNTALTSLDLRHSSLTSLDVSQNTALTSFLLVGTSLESLDLSQNTALEYLDCFDNFSLESLNLSGATALTEVYCYQNSSLVSLNVSGATALQFLYSVDNNQLTSLDVSQNTALTDLYCYDNSSLVSLNVSGITALQFLICYNNQLTSLDVSQHTALRDLECQNNQLTCIQMNQTQLDNLSSRWSKDTFAVWSTNCP